MGEAKRRGTRDERVKKASENSGTMAHTTEPKLEDAKHYCFVFDRSDNARRMIDELRRGPQELRDRLASSAFQMLEKSESQYRVVWGTLGMTGGLTIGAATLDDLLNLALPEAVKRTTEKGGLCAFTITVDPAAEQPIRDELERLQAANSTREQPNDDQDAIRTELLKGEDGKQLTMITIPRHVIEKGDTEQLAGILRSNVSTKEVALRSFQTACWHITGYDDDPRELWDIEEVRRYFGALIKKTPWWIHLPHFETGAFFLIAMIITPALSPTESNGPLVRRNIDVNAFAAIVRQALAAATSLYAGLGISEEECRELLAVLATSAVSIGTPPEIESEVAASSAARSRDIDGTSRGADLLDLAISLTGREVEPDLIQFLTPEAFARFSDVLAQSASRTLACGDTEPTEPQFECRAQEDGRLVMRCVARGMQNKTLTFHKHEWRELTRADLAAISRAVPQPSADLLEALAGDLKRLAQKQSGDEQRWRTELQAVTRKVYLFDRTTSSLEMLKPLTKHSPYLRDRVEAWLAGADAFVLVLVLDGDRRFGVAVAADETDLCETLFGEMARDGVADKSTALVPVGIDNIVSQRARRQWRALGGVARE